MSLFWFYVALQCDSIRELLPKLTTISIWMCAVVLFFMAVYVFSEGLDTPIRENMSKVKKRYFLVGLFPLVFTSLSAFVPTTKNALILAGAHTVINSETVQQGIDRLATTLGKTWVLLDNKLDEMNAKSKESK